ncbi:unnamed protein product [Bursaphelenchus xylophilus]|uniref:(pine wood nematode) hypothetical protein n=1 Tax=Bursaphelenchus xylophilus TaxID=6326 RepID=A0A1I7RYI3_BURXY|nr:unnamed protein product [Bursaphelenchus xylophilus]CAG9092653.1 unnamed protein product [Bursaphelenchus xylophilus]
MKWIYIVLGLGSAGLVLSETNEERYEREFAEKMEAMADKLAPEALAETMVNVMQVGGIKLPKDELTAKFLEEYEMYSSISRKFDLKRLFDFIVINVTKIREEDLLGEPVLRVSHLLSVFRHQLRGKIGTTEMTKLDRAIAVLSFMYFQTYFVTRYSTLNRRAGLGLSSNEIFDRLLHLITQTFEIGLAIGYNPVNEYHAWMKALGGFDAIPFERALDAYLKALNQLFSALETHGAAAEDIAFLSEEFQTVKKFRDENLRRKKRMTVFYDL